MIQVIGMAYMHAFAKRSILRYPRLDTILMVEKAIANAKEYPTKTELWRSLPKGIMYQTFCTILDYLQESNKIFIREGRIIWIWNPEGVRKYLSKPHLAWKRD
jgi:hypothetical protein